MNMRELHEYIEQIKDALGTAENGESLIEVARNAYKAEQANAAIIIYCEGVESDFPETRTWMQNIIKLARGNQP